MQSVLQGDGGGHLCLLSAGPAHRGFLCQQHPRHHHCLWPATAFDPGSCSCGGIGGYMLHHKMLTNAYILRDSLKIVIDMSRWSRGTPSRRRWKKMLPLTLSWMSVSLGLLPSLRPSLTSSLLPLASHCLSPFHTRSLLRKHPPARRPSQRRSLQPIGRRFGRSLQPLRVGLMLVSPLPTTSMKALWTKALLPVFLVTTKAPKLPRISPPAPGKTT